MIFKQILLLLFCVSFKWNACSIYYEEDRQQSFDPEAHGLPKENTSEVDTPSWSEIFAEEYKQMMEKEQMTKPRFLEDNDVFYGKFEVVHGWPQEKLPVGQISGIATNKNGLLYIFHRANRIWHQNSFNELNFYQDYNGSVIKEPTILVINSTDGAIVGHWGRNLFVLPHGIEVDSENNIYVTDVALHQVFKFESGKETPSLILGEAFKPAESNDDVDKFCMPTGVTVSSNGDFYVSDGYCASRILKYDKKGTLLKKFGDDDSNIPHGITLAEDLDYLCVADREGMRVLCYQAGIKDPDSIGKPVAQFTNENFGRVFDVAYSPVDGLLYGVLGKTGILRSQGFSVDLKDNEAYDADVLAFWSPDDKGFHSPHTLAVSKDGKTLYVGETGLNVVWKFEKDY